jgi:hypothetical protein
MKVAIVGQGPLAIESACALWDLGAFVTVYTQGDWGDEEAILAKFASDFSRDLPFSGLTTSIGRKIVKDSLGTSFNPSKVPTYQEYWQDYLLPLINFLKKGPRQNLRISDSEILSVSKRFLSPGQSKKNVSRLNDLFRVIYKVNPLLIEKTQLDKIKEMGEEIAQSLVSDFENFEDFDLVIDARGASSNRERHVVNESLLKEKFPKSLMKGSLVFSNMEDMINHSRPRIIIESCNSLSALFLVLLYEKCDVSSKLKISIMSDEEDLFATFLSTPGNSELKEKLKNVLAENECKFNREVEVFEEEVRSWRGLDSYVQQKVPMPSMPQRSLEFFPQSVVSGLDKLIDRDEFYLTVDNYFSSEFVEEVASKTLAFDFFCSFSAGLLDMSIFEELDFQMAPNKQALVCTSGIHNEPGFYSLGASSGDLSKQSNLVAGIEEIDSIINNMLQFFSRK